MTTALAKFADTQKRLGGSLTTLLRELDAGKSRNAACATAGIHPMRLSRYMRKAETDEASEENQRFAVLVLAAEANDEEAMWAKVRQLAESSSSDKVKLEAAKFYLEKRHGYSQAAQRSSNAPVELHFNKIENIIEALDGDSDRPALQEGA